jgi:hypothetical protein
MLMSQLDELMKKTLAGKASVKELQELSVLSAQHAKEIGEKAILENIQKVKEFITKTGLDIKATADALLNEPILKWGEHIKESGLKGRLPGWSKELKQAMSKAEALKLALNDEGKKFVEKIYAEAKKPVKKKS